MPFAARAVPEGEWALVLARRRHESSVRRGDAHPGHRPRWLPSDEAEDVMVTASPYAKVATAAMDLAIGTVIGSLVPAVAGSAPRRGGGRPTGI